MRSRETEKTASRRSLQNSACSLVTHSVMPLSFSAQEQTRRTEADGEERKCGGERHGARRKNIQLQEVAVARCCRIRASDKSKVGKSGICYCQASGNETARIARCKS